MNHHFRCYNVYILKWLRSPKVASHTTSKWELQAKKLEVYNASNKKRSPLLVSHSSSKLRNPNHHWQYLGGSSWSSPSPTRNHRTLPVLLLLMNLKEEKLMVGNRSSSEYWFYEVFRSFSTSNFTSISTMLLVESSSIWPKRWYTYNFDSSLYGKTVKGKKWRVDCWQLGDSKRHRTGFEILKNKR